MHPGRPPPRRPPARRPLRTPPWARRRRRPMRGFRAPGGGALRNCTTSLTPAEKRGGQVVGRRGRMAESIDLPPVRPPTRYSELVGLVVSIFGWERGPFSLQGETGG